MAKWVYWELEPQGNCCARSVGQEVVLHALGIDIEFIDSSKLGSLEKSVAREGLPPGTEQSRGVLLALSAKEAVFKAQYPLTGKLLSFSDVALVWTPQDAENFSATVECSDMIGVEIRCVQTAMWTVSVALMPAKP